MLLRIFRWGLRLALGLALLALAGYALLWTYPRLHGVSGSAPPAQPALLAVSHVNLLNPGQPAELDRTVLIASGRFQAIVDGDQPIPVGYELVDGAGGWLIPGLIDTHVHIIDEADMALLLTHGITTARNMLGRPIHLQLRAAVQLAELSGPRLITASRTLNTTDRSGTFHDMVYTPEQARAAVRQAKADGYDLIKVYDGLKLPVFEAIVAEARAQGLPITGHPPNDVPFDQFLAASVSIEHVEELWQGHLKDASDDQIHKLAAQISASGKPLVATLEVVQRLADVCAGGAPALEALQSPQLNPLYAWMGQRSLADWVNETDLDWCQRWRARTVQMQHIVLLMHQAGVPIALGSDSGPHRTVHGAATLLELARLQAAGLSAEEVLAAATRNAALVLGRSQDLGAIARGYLADGLLLSKDPRADLRVVNSPLGILAQGRWYDAEAQAKLQADGEQHAGFLLSIGRLLQ